MPRKYTDSFMLRLPDGWRDEIKLMAVRNRRSMTEEILTCLEGKITPQSIREEVVGHTKEPANAE